MSASVRRSLPSPRPTPRTPQAPPAKVAVIGIGCRFPGGANDHRSFWRNLAEGKDCITPTPPDRYDAAGLGSRDKAKPGRLVGGRGGYIDGFDEFDPAFFGISPREAHAMDPQQRKLLEVAWEALEDGGQRPGELAGSDVGVFVGAFTLDYKILQFSDLRFDTIEAHTATGTMMTMVSNRLSHCFDFRGPSLSIDSACSSSLVAVHLACDSLRRGESSLALAGGTLLHLTPQYTIAETKGGFLSPEGRSRTFDAGADGYVRAEGVGIVALKLLADAVRDGDPIHAVVTETGVNQDGRTNGITVPSAAAQTALIEQVCARAGITPGSLQYVEAHGTSTPVGDPIEANALASALAVGRRPDAACYVGSVKTNIGHTESAAGIAGLIKTALSLEHRLIPPHINLERVNPAIDLEAAPYEIPDRLTPWPAHEGLARAGVNSFGFGGTNAHVLLEEAPARPAGEAPYVPQEGRPATDRPRFAVLPLSAHDAAVLPALAGAVRAELFPEGPAAAPPSALADLAHSLARRRQHHDARLSVVYETRDDLDEALAAYGRGEKHPRVLLGRREEGRQASPVWVFTGMGPQWWGMGRELFATAPAYREAVQAVDREITAQAGWSLIAELKADEHASRMAETWLAQPANFAVQVGLAALWHAHGVQPSAVVGHSTGEVAAFYEAGVYSLRDAVRIVLHRSRLQHRLAGTGTMLAVGLSEEEAVRRAAPFGRGLSIAAVNSPGSLTLAGDGPTLTAYAEELRADGVFTKFLDVQVPYHSAAMDGIRAELLRELAGIEPRPAGLPLHLTGREGRAEGPELDADYWWSNVRDTVRFRSAVDALIDDGHRTFLEIGPHPVLGHSVKECFAARDSEGTPGSASGSPGARRPVTTLASIRRDGDETLRFTTSLAALYTLGCGVDWSVLHPRGRLVPLPRYPWKRERYWTEPAPVAQVRLGRVDHPLLGRRIDTAEPTWEVALDVEDTPYLADHRIQGRTLFPAAGYIEMAHQAVRALTGGTDTVLANIELRKALFLTDDAPHHVQLSLSEESSAFTVASAGDAPAVHARGVLRGATPGGRTVPLDRKGAQARAVGHLDAAACYEALGALGYDYGPAFRGIAEVWRGQDEALALVRLPACVESAPAGHHLHPVLLDACFQTLLVAGLPGADAAHGRGMLLPLTIEEVRTAPAGDRPLWAHATVTRRADGELVGDIVLCTQDGEPAGHVRGFRAADVEQAPATVGAATIDGWLAELTWTDAPPERDEAAPAPAAPGTWLLFADRPGGVADSLAALGAARGARCHLVRPGDTYVFDRGGRDSRVVPGDAGDLRRLLADLAARPGEPPLGTVVHLWNLDLPALDDTARARLDAHTALGSYSVLALAQALQDSPGQRTAPAALHLVTRGAQAVVPGDRVEPLGAPVWGVGRVLRHQELTAHRGKLIDLPPLETSPGDATGPRQYPARPAPDGSPPAPGPEVRAAADAEALLSELLAPHVPDRPQDEVALRPGRRLVSGLARPDGLTRSLPPRLRPDGAYLVTGAFGALGRLLCRYLVDRGARHLILVGRTELPDRATWRALGPDVPENSGVRFVKELEALGAHPVHAALDISDEQAFTRWLADYRDRDAPPVRGVFHLAGHVQDTPAQSMDRTAFASVFDPKAAGAWLLHHHLRDEPLDHFVLFASIASLLTTTGQANYAAGNAFLDALAHHRRSRGMPALSLDWGPWATGMIEELSLFEHYRSVRGMNPLSPSAGTAVLERVLGQDRAQLLIAHVVDWKTFLAWYPSPPPLVMALAADAARSAAPGSGTGTPDEQGGYLDQFRAAAGEEERARLVADRLLGCASAVLRMGTDRFDLDGGLGALGLDSLLAMELRARIQAETGVALPVVALLSGAPLRELAAQLHDATAALAVAGAGAQGAAAVEVYDDPARHPLTQNQKALWFLKQLHPDGFAYNIGGAVEVRTEIEPELMTAAVRALVVRHPVLRANFVLRDGRPLQVVSDITEPDTEVVDVEGMDWDAIRELMVAEYRRPYDLARDRLMRFRLYRRGPDRWVLMKAVHHIVSDAISTFTFIEELLALYEGMRAGRATELPPVRGRYVDFLNRQNAFLASPAADRMLEYWRGALPAEVPPLALHTDAPRPPVQTHNGASEFFVLDDDLSARVRTLAREHDVTVFVVLLCAYYLLLHRHSGQDDIVVGSPVTGRTDEDLSSVYGYFVNPLPLYANLAGEPTVAELLAQVRTTVLGGIDHQEYPFVLLVEKLGLQHDPSRSAVFQAMFILLAHKVSSKQYGYHLDYIELPEEEGQFDLTLSAYEDEVEHRFHCVLKYNTDLFRPETARRFAEHYRNLLDALTRAPGDRQATGLDMLGEGERREILHGPSARGPVRQQDVPVHRLFVRAAARTPDAVAVTVPAAGPAGEARHLTYAELERASGALAARLRARGVSGGVVAVCLPKSPELVVALLAVLRAGAAYLPLDPGHPAQRLAFMAGNAGATLVLTDPAGAGRLTVPGAQILTDIMAEGPTGPADDTPVRAADDTPAYVIHTSGSTGRPKAVRVSHGALAALSAAWREEYGLETAPGVHLQLAGVSFDVFTGDLVRALCSGGRLVLADRELLLNTARLYEAMTAEGVDCAEFVPAVARALLNHCEQGGHRLDFMRLLIVGSDAWKVAEYERLRRLCGPDTRLVNSYGLTEATIDSACFDGPTDGLDPHSTVPIGTPLPNCVLHVLDAHRGPVPPGVTGELWVGGAGLALGYAGDEEQTGRRFVSVTLDRGADATPERLYRTGDLARRDPQGRIHLIGRADSQIKLRGHRIEPGEIESLLMAFPGVTDACVLVRNDAGGEPALCAYVVRAADATPDTRALRRHLAAQLPTYLIPAHLQVLDSLPLTPNGKVDQDALPAPRPEAPGEEHEPPVTLYEERMAEHWKAVIGLERVGLRSDFFDSGGSSITLIELIHLLQREFGIAIPVGLLFKVTTLHGMARTVEDIVTGRVSGSLSHLAFNSGGGPVVFCFPPAGGHGLVYRNFARHLPSHELIAFNHIDGDKTTRYADLVESIRPAGPCTLLGYSLGGNLAFEVAKELERRGREVPHVVIMDSYRIEEEYGLSAEHVEAFEHELRDHLRRHTRSETVTEQTLHQARDYLEYCGRTPNLGTVTATLTVISDDAKASLYAAGRPGSWHSASATGSRLVRGAGLHAEMLDEKPARRNAALVLAALGDAVPSVPREPSAAGKPAVALETGTVLETRTTQGDSDAA